MRDLYDTLIDRFDPWAVEDDFIPTDNEEWYTTPEDDTEEVSLEEYLETAQL